MRAAIVLVVIGVTSLVFPLSVHGTTLGVDGAQFTLNGKRAFLLGLSYYGALGASEDSLRSDLDDARRCGFNWLRVWVTWESFGRDVSAVDGTGDARQPFMDRLKWLVAECDRRGMVLDLTLTRGASPMEAPMSGRLPTMESHRQAVKTLVSELKPWRNWYLDLANEHDVGDSRHVSMQEIGELRAFVRELDRDRLVTASFGGHDLDEQDLRSALVTGKLDILAPHRPRNAESPRQTEEVTRRMLEQMKQLGFVVPVLYQEPFRRGYAEWEPTVDDFLTDLQGAIAGGAAGWCLHNGKQGDAPDGQPRRSFDVSARRLFDQFDEQERKVLERLPQVRVGADKPADQHNPANTDELRKVSVLRTGPQAGHYLQWRGKPLMLIGDSGIMIGMSVSNSVLMRLSAITSQSDRFSWRMASMDVIQV